MICENCAGAQYVSLGRNGGTRLSGLEARKTKNEFPVPNSEERIWSLKYGA